MREDSTMCCRSTIELMLILALGVLVAPLAAQAQEVEKGVRVGVLLPIPPVSFPAFKPRLQELGYVEGQNLVLEVRVAERKFDRFPGLAAELVRLHVDVIVTVGPEAALWAARGATATIPIVMIARDYDPI